MSSVITWSQTAGSNNSAPPNGWPEGMARSAVNDTARENMSAIAKYRDDIAGATTADAAIVAGGSANALTVTSNSVIAANTNGFEITFRAASTNTGSATLSVDGQTAKTIQAINGTNLSGGEIIAGATYTAVYFTTVDRWLLLNANVPVVAQYTPTITGSTGAPVVTYSRQDGRYCKFGRLVYVEANVHMASKSGGSGDINVSLPFARTAGGAASGTISFGGVFTNAIDLTSVASISAVVQGTDAFASLLGMTTGTGTFSVPLSAFDGTDGLAFSLVYIVAS